MVRHWLRRLARQLQRPAPSRKAARAKRGPALEHLEDRITPSTLDFQNGALIYTASQGAASNFTISLSGSTYTLSDSAETITVTAAAQAAGFGGSGTNTVTGPDGSALKAIQVTLGGLNDTANIRSFDKPLSLTTGAGNDTINVSSTGLTGNLNGIAADLSIDAGAGANTLNVSNYTATSGDANVVIGSGTITGFAGPSGGSVINYKATGGTFSLLHVLGSNSPTLAQTFTVNNPNATLFQLNADNGTNTINVEAISGAANIVGGLGVDNIVVCSTADLTGNLDGIRGTLSIDGGQGANTLTVSDAGTAGPANTAVITATQITGLAGANNDQTISYKAVGGSFSKIHVVGAADASLADQFTVNNPNGPLVLDTGAGNDTVNVLALTKSATINGGSGNDTFNVSSDAPANLGTLNGINGALTVNAGSGSNVLAVSDYGQTSLTDNVTVTPSAITGIAGSSKATAINYSGTFSSVILTGSHANANTFSVSGSTAAVLQGGNANDTFNLGNGASAKSIDGGAGSDTLNGVSDATLTSSATAGFSGTAANGINFSGIEVLGGSGSLSNGEGAAGTWTVGSQATFSDGAHPLSFGGFTALDAGSAGDTFAVQAGASGYALNGGAGGDTLSGVSNVTLTGSGASSGYAGTADNAITFTGIDAVSGSGSFTGDDNASAFTIGDTSSYNDGATASSLSFSGFATVVGGAGNDVFTISVPGSATVATLGTLDGGAGTNTLNATNVNFAAHIADGYSYTNFQVVTASETFTGPDAATTYEWNGTAWLMNGVSIGTPGTIQAGSGDDTFIVDAGTTTDTNLLGGGGDDTFTVGAGASAIGAIDGGTGTNTLNLAGSVTLTGSENDAAEVGYLGSSASLGSGGFVGISVLNDTSATPGALSGESGANGTWTVGDSSSAASSYADNTAAGVSLTFSGFATLNAGAGDTFNLATDPSTGFTINGGAGSDTLNGVSDASLTSSTDAGFSGTANNGISFSGIDVLGGSGSLSNGETVAGTWALGSQATFSDGAHTLSFSGFTALDAGSAGDTFAVRAGASGYALNGGAGSDTLSGVSNAVLSSSDATGIGGSADSAITFSGIDVLTGSGALTGENVASTWALGGSNSYSDGTATLTFSGFATVNAGTAGDTFNIGGATDVTAANGGSGNDTFNIGGNAALNLTGGAGDDAFNFTRDAAVLTGTIDGGTGTDTLSYAGTTSPVAVTLTGTGSTGLKSNLASGLTSFKGIDVLVGGQGTTDSLTGLNVASTWTLGSANTYSNGTATLSFSGFEAVNAGTAGDTFNIGGATDVASANGGVGDDTFNVNGDAALSVNGGAGSNVLSYLGYKAAAVAVALTGSESTGLSSTSATGLTSFSGINVLVGGPGAGDSLTGENVASTWSLGGSNSYSDGTASLAFSGFEAVNAGTAGDTFNIGGASDVTSANGGSGNDTFNVNANAAMNLNGNGGNDTFNLGDGVVLSGTIDGGAGSDTLSYAEYTSAVSVALQSSDATGYASDSATGVSGFKGIDVIVGGAANDTLTGENAASTWDVGATQTYDDGAGHGALTFSGFESLASGTGNDTFNVTQTTAGVPLSLNAGGGNVTFNVSNLAGVLGDFSVNGGTGASTLNVDDSADTLAVGWVIDGSTVQQFNAGAISYANLAGVTVTSGTPAADGPSNALDVEGVAAGTSLTVRASQTDVTVAQVANALAGIQGSLVIDAVGPNVTVTVNDSLNTSDTHYTIDGATGTIATDTVAITVLEEPVSVTVLGGMGNNTFDVTPSASYPIYVEGGLGGVNTLAYHYGTSTTWTDDGSVISDSSGLVQPVFYFDFTTVQG